MIPPNRVDEVLRDLLKSRRVPVDEDRLESIRVGLRHRSVPLNRRQAPGFFSRHRVSLSFATAMVLIGLIVWSLAPLRQDSGQTLVSSRLLEILEDEQRVDQALVLLGGFASTPFGEDATAAWDPFGRSLLGQYQAEVLLQTLYESI